MGLEVVKAEGTQDEVKGANDEKNPLEIPKEEEKPVVNIYEPEEEEGEKKHEEEKPAEKPAGTGKAGEKEGESEKEEEVKKTPDELTELRQIAREQKRQISKMSEDLESAKSALQKAELLPTDDPDVAKKAQELQELRANALDTMLEMMELNPKFEDVRVVVTQSRFDDVVEAMAEYIQKEEGGKLSDHLKKVETSVWAMTNPYKFMYGKIKQYHPDFVKPKDEVAKVKEEEKKVEKKNAGTKEGKEANPPKIPGSILDLQGGGSGDAGWTSAMIDALEETELSKVPPKIYEQYLKNELA